MNAKLIYGHTQPSDGVYNLFILNILVYIDIYQLLYFIFDSISEYLFHFILSNYSNNMLTGLTTCEDEFPLLNSTLLCPDPH